MLFRSASSGFKKSFSASAGFLILLLPPVLKSAAFPGHDISLTAQNSKTIRIIFLPKCTQKNYAFYAVFYTFFLRISVLSGKTKSALAMIFCGYFYINRPWWVSPLFNSAKIRTKGVIGLWNNYV